MKTANAMSSRGAAFLSVFSHALMLILLAGAALPSAAATLPDPASGGRDGGPMDLLIYRGHCEMKFGIQPPLDAEYMKRLKDAGYRVTVLGEVTEAPKGTRPDAPGEWRPLTLEYLRQFNTVIYLSPSPYMGGGYFDHTKWRSGRHLLTARDNVEVLTEYVREGGGLLIVPSLEELCMRTVESLQDLFGRFGLWTECALVRDEKHAFVPEKIARRFSVVYSWTDKVADHPAAAGVKHIWYPAYCTRWDDNYTTVPLFIRDPAWVPLVQAMPEAGCVWLRGNIYATTATFHPAEGMPGTPALVAAREFGKGRLAVTGVGAYHLFYLTYAEIGKFAEANFSVVDGIAMEHGNTRRDPWKIGDGPVLPSAIPTPESADERFGSDMLLLLNNLYAWLGAPSASAGWGGGPAKGGVAPGEAESIPDDFLLFDVWPEDDPDTPEREARPMKILVGARSAASSGQGSPAAWADAAKRAGIDVVCFTETLEDVNIGAWTNFVAACAAASDDAVALLPGLDIESDLGDRFLVIGHTLPIRTHILTPDQKKMWWTGHMLLGMGDTLPVVARPQRLAQARDGKGALPPELYVACPGVAVATYREGKQVDDGMFAWRWQAHNASQPIPVAVHELSAPGEVEWAARTGLLNIVNADTPRNAAYSFRQGHASFGGNPMRYYLSSGPVVERCTIDDWRSNHWTINLQARSDTQIVELVAEDQNGVYRRLSPGTTAIDSSFSGNLGMQKWMMIHLKDAAGGEAWLSQIRTLPKAANIRCMDRQNWFSPLGWQEISYTGKTITKGGFIQAPGVNLAEPHCVKLRFAFSGEGFYIHDNLYDSTWVPGGNRFGGDNSPMWHDLPIPEYEAYTRFITILQNGRPTGARQCIAHFKAKRELVPEGNVWPVFASACDARPVPYTYGEGAERKEGEIPADGFVDLPPGGVAGNIMALTPLRVDGAGKVGLAAPTGKVAAGTVLTGSFTWVPAELRGKYGFDGPTPFTLKMTQGKHGRTAWYMYFTAERYGVAGTVKGGEMPGVGKAMPLKISGANPRWPLGVWHSGSGNLTMFDFFESEGLGQLDVTTDGEFYAGSILTANNPEIVLAFASDWTKTGARIEVANPTGKDIECEVRSPDAIKGRKPIAVKVKVPAGKNVYVDVK